MMRNIFFVFANDYELEERIKKTIEIERDFFSSCRTQNELNSSFYADKDSYDNRLLKIFFTQNDDFGKECKKHILFFIDNRFGHNNSLWLSYGKISAWESCFSSENTRVMVFMIGCSNQIETMLSPNKYRILVDSDALFKGIKHYIRSAEMLYNRANNKKQYNNTNMIESGKRNIPEEIIEKTNQDHFLKPNNNSNNN